PELGVPLERFDPRACVVRHSVRRGDDEVAVGPLLAPPDASTELVELRQPEDVGAVDDDSVRPRDVEPALHDRRRDEDVAAALDEVEHRLLERALAGGILTRARARARTAHARAGHLAVRDGDPRVRKERLDAVGLLVDALDAIEDVEHLAAAGELAADRFL